MQDTDVMSSTLNRVFAFFSDNILFCRTMLIICGIFNQFPYATARIVVNIIQFLNEEMLRCYWLAIKRSFKHLVFLSPVFIGIATLSCSLLRMPYSFCSCHLFTISYAMNLLPLLTIVLMLLQEAEKSISTCK